MATGTDSTIVQRTGTKSAITPAILGLIVGLAGVLFAFPLYRATKLYQPASLYFIDGLPPWGFLTSIALSLLAALAVIFLLCFAATRIGVRSQTIERLLAAAVILGAAVALTSHYGLAPIKGWPVGVLVAAIGASGAQFAGIMRAVLSRLCLIMLLGCIAVLGYEVASAAFSSHQAAEPKFVKGTPDAPAIVVLLFDELDEELAFHLRPARVDLPNITKFNSEALHATRMAPIADMTTIAIPSLLTGQVVGRAEPRSPARLELFRADGSKMLEARDTIFATLKAQGLNSAALGWHHPYCGLFASELAACESYPNVDATDSSRVAFYYGLKSPRLFVPLSDIAQREFAEQYEAVAEAQYRQVQDGLRTLSSWIADRRLNFIWAHFPYPHPPGMMAVNGNQGRANYFDNLVLTDNTVGTVMAELKRTGRWDDSIVVVTGDHGLRRKIWEHRPVWTEEEDRILRQRKQESVPFIVHLPRQVDYVSFTKPLSGLVLHDVLLEWAQGRLTTPGELVSWLASRSQ